MIHTSLLAVAATLKASASLQLPDLRPDSKLELLLASGGLLEKVGLNPQPLPPREAGAAPLHSVRFIDDDWCGTKPKGFPPPPPPPLGNAIRVALQSVAL